MTMLRKVQELLVLGFERPRPDGLQGIARSSTPHLIRELSNDEWASKRLPFRAPSRFSRIQSFRGGAQARLCSQISARTTSLIS